MTLTPCRSLKFHFKGLPDREREHHLIKKDGSVCVCLISSGLSAPSLSVLSPSGWFRFIFCSAALCHDLSLIAGRTCRHVSAGLRGSLTHCFLCLLVPNEVAGSSLMCNLFLVALLCLRSVLLRVFVMLDLSWCDFVIFHFKFSSGSIQAPLHASLLHPIYDPYR